MLIISGDKDHTVPPAVAKASYRLEQRNGGVTEFLTIENRGHSLTIEGGWRDVADKALAFMLRYATASKRSII